MGLWKWYIKKRIDNVFANNTDNNTTSKTYTYYKNNSNYKWYSIDDIKKVDNAYEIHFFGHHTFSIYLNERNDNGIERDDLVTVHEIPTNHPKSLFCHRLKNAVYTTKGHERYYDEYHLFVPIGMINDSKNIYPKWKVIRMQ